MGYNQTVDYTRSSSFKGAGVLAGHCTGTMLGSGMLLFPPQQQAALVLVHTDGPDQDRRRTRFHGCMQFKAALSCRGRGKAGTGYLDVGPQVGGSLLTHDCQELVGPLLHRLIPFLDTVHKSG